MNESRLLRSFISNCSLHARYYSTKKLKDHSSFALNQEINRRIRDKALEALLVENPGCSNQNTFENQGLDSISSVAVRRVFERDVDKYTSQFPDVVHSVKKHILNNVASAKNKTEHSCKNIDFPYNKFVTTNCQPDDEKVDTDSNSLNTSNTSTTESGLHVAPDRGFFVSSDSFKDEYVIGSSIELPQEKQFSLTNRKYGRLHSDHDSSRGNRCPEKIFKRVGPADAVEEIEFQLPHQDRKNETYSDATSQDEWAVKYGCADLNIPPAPADVQCKGCGARLHCNYAGLPGFLPVEYFAELADKDFKSGVGSKDEHLLCRRCYLLKHHNFLLNVNVTSADYERMLSRLRSRHDILIVLIVDMLDFPCSIYKHLPDLVGIGKHVIVVGNKVDLIPPDDSNPNYLKHYTKCLRQAVVDAGFNNHFNVLSVQLISAKTGFGIEPFISRIYQRWAGKGDIYLVGCTNSGKSTLFNALLQSDLCKVRAVDLVERATSSIWPGTTLNLLKFPVMNPTPIRMIKRESRLKLMNSIVEKEEQHRKLLYDRTGDQEYACLQGYIGQTFANPEGIPSSVLSRLSKNDVSLQSSMHFIKNPYEQKSKSEKNISLDTQTEFILGNWCFDTPGTVNQDQIINILTLEELVKTLPSSLIKPKLVTLNKNQSLLVAGLVRIDLIEVKGKQNNCIKLFIYRSEQLPLFVLERWEVASFYSKFVGTKVLEVPYGGDERLKKFPQLVHTNVDIEGSSSVVGPGAELFCADIVLSSVGWASLSAPRGHVVRLKVWTPGGTGVYVRRPALLPGGGATATSQLQPKPRSDSDVMEDLIHFGQRQRDLMDDLD